MDSAPDELMRPIGSAEGAYVKEPMAALVVRINREALHHGAETALPLERQRVTGR